MALGIYVFRWALAAELPNLLKHLSFRWADASFEVQ